MKNVLILGLVALLLFSVSATLSVWLNQPHPAPEEAQANTKVAPKKSSGKAKPTPAEDDPDAEGQRPVFRPKSSPASEDAGHLSAQLREQLAAVKERESRLDRRQAQLDLVMHDIRGERQALDALRKQVAAEVKQIADKLADADKRVADREAERLPPPKAAANTQKQAPDPDDEKKIVAMYESMPAETAARILQQMADTGKLDSAARILSQMKERNASKVLSEIADTTLTEQLVGRMKRLRPAQSNGSFPP